jgi:hypothetical protein
MKIDKSVVLSFVLLVLIASLYRIMPGRPLGFAPQIAMALFGGAVIKDRKLSFLLPVLSMLVSDILYEILFITNVFPVPGFYEGQLLNYLLFVAITVIGFSINSNKPLQILGGAIVGAGFYFIASNFIVWIGGGLDINNLPYPKTMSGLVYCYTAALPFFKGSLYASVFFSGVLFGGYYLLTKFFVKKPLLA